jgi:hypothetical protein
VYRGFVAVVLVACCLLSGGTAAATNPGAEFRQENVDPDDVLLSVELEPDGDAVWTIEYRVELTTEEEQQAFDELQADVENDPDSFTGQFRNRMAATTADAASATGREMAVENVSVTASQRELPRQTGVLAYSFRWTNFAATDGDRLRVGDAVDGLFLDDNSVLLLSWPEEYELANSTPEPSETRDGAAEFVGPTNFEAGGPRLELVSGGGGASDELGTVPTALGALVAILVVGGIGGFAIAQRDDDGSTEDDRSDDDPEDGDPEDDGELDPEFLSNDEQVLQLIENNGGRMKQQDVVEELGWTDAKTSQVTMELREEDRLEAFRVGRENVLALPGERDET